MNIPFSFIFVFVLFPVLILGAFLLNLMRTKKDEEIRFRTGVKFLKSFRKLLTHVQQHRGLTNSYLSGNKKAKSDIGLLELSIKAEISEIEVVDLSIRDNPKWESILDHWGRLNDHYDQLSVETNMRQHNILISNVLYLIDDIAYQHHLGKVGLVESTDTDWRHLLTVAENIGQARALGMGVVSRGVCTSVARIQLNHLREKIVKQIEPSWSENCLADFSHFINVLDEKVIVEEPSITPDDYFSLTTRCIEHVLQEFDHQVDRIQFQHSR